MMHINEVDPDDIEPFIQDPELYDRLQTLLFYNEENFIEHFPEIEGLKLVNSMSAGPGMFQFNFIFEDEDKMAYVVLVTKPTIH